MTGMQIFIAMLETGKPVAMPEDISSKGMEDSLHYENRSTLHISQQVPESLSEKTFYRFRAVLKFPWIISTGP